MPLVPLLAIAALLAGGRRVIWLAVPGLIGALALIAVEAGGGHGDVAGPGVVVVTHNVGRENRDPEGTVTALAHSGADILLLQETDGTVAPFLRRLRAQYPFASRCRRRCSFAIFSRWPLGRDRWRFRNAGGRAVGPGLMQVPVRLPWGSMARLATVHLSRLGTGEERAAQRVSLAGAVGQVSDPALILAGDFNLTPWGRPMRRLDTALAPLHRTTRATFSFPARWHGWRVPWPLLPLDHLYAGPAWRVASVQRLPATGSDHFPVRVNLVWNNRGI
ncbi:endonuclease/exonuclease/phosphatase family protein [Sphingomonas solaris]|nr:endonuclease/exonuclease/phosphatase family protein [Sphingomonas solaris]